MPKWARDEILVLRKNLERAVARAEAAASCDPAKTDTLIWSDGGSGIDFKGLPPGVSVRYCFPNEGRGERPHVDVGLRMRGGDYCGDSKVILSVNSSTGTLSILPRAANAVYIVPSE